MEQPLPLRLSARGLSKRYGVVQALNEVTFQLRPGEVMALLGENGAGKSTIVKVLSGLIRPDEGAIEIDGSPVDISSSSSSQVAGISVVQQEYSTVGPMSVGENLVLGQASARLWWSPKFLRRNARQLLDRVGLAHIDCRTLVEDLSVAEMQLLEIAKVLARDAKIVIFDEPTAALSDAEIVRVLSVVRKLASEGRSIVYVTHRLNEVFEIADRVTIFRNGRSHAPVDVADLDVERVITMMLGRELGNMYPARSNSRGDVALRIDGLTAPNLESPIDLKVRRGEILGLTGQLGSGASVLVQALAGVVPALSGSASIDGEPISLKSRQAGIRSGVAYCSADRKKDGIFAGTSIQRNLSSPWIDRVARLGVVSSRDEKRRASETASQFAIDLARLRSNVGTLSGGNQQKVALGKWLGIGPRVLLVEEPTRGVDVGARSEIYRQLRALCDEGLVVVVSSSDTNEIFGLCDVIATFKRGSLSAVRPSSEWTEESLVRDVMQSEGVTA